MNQPKKYTALASQHYILSELWHYNRSTIFFALAEIIAEIGEGFGTILIPSMIVAFLEQYTKGMITAAALPTAMAKLVTFFVGYSIWCMITGYLKRRNQFQYVKFRCSRMTERCYQKFMSLDYVQCEDEKVQQLLKKAGESEEYEGMGTTLVVASIFGSTLRVANVGDSRLYVIGEDITQITRDHSLVEEMVQLGQIDRKAARTHEKKNYITRAIGGCETVEAEMFSVDLNDNDIILMCSDGLTNMLEDSEIFHIVKESADIKTAADSLVKKANYNGGKDNISVVLIEP